jgi:hypothetical protein
MKKESSAIAGNTGCRRGGVFSIGKKGALGAKNRSCALRCIRKNVNTGCEKPCQAADQKQNHSNYPDSP